MLKEFRFPDVGEGIAEGEIVRWLVQEGDSIKEDQELVEVETDKAVITLNSPYTGKIEKLHGREGEIIKVGSLLTTIQEPAEKSSEAAPEKKDSGSVVGSLGQDEEIAIARPILATPAVRALAKEMKVDLARIRGTGPGGRITKEDLERDEIRIAEPQGDGGRCFWPRRESAAARAAAHHCETDG